MPTPRRSLTVVLPIPSGQLGPNGRVHWRKKHNLFQEAKSAAWVEFHNARTGPTWQGPVHLDLLWVAQRQQWLPDVDQALARCKAYLDAGQGMVYMNDRQVQVRSIRREVGSNPRVELTFEAVAQEGGDDL
jgi:Holliday junction resolvase RusA-like endonuclease